jgi:hypothetical protein
MAATIKSAISPFRQLLREPNSSSAVFLDEDLAAIPATRIADEFRKLSRFLPVIVLVPKPAVCERAPQNKPGPNKSDAGLKPTATIPSPLDAAKA